MAGDFNQLSDADVKARTGLTSIVSVPTRGQNFLDRVYTSNDTFMFTVLLKL